MKIITLQVLVEDVDEVAILDSLQKWFYGTKVGMDWHDIDSVDFSDDMIVKLADGR